MSSTRFVHLVARGVSEDLGHFAGGPEAFAEQRASASAVVVDAAALWLKLRREGGARAHGSEIHAAGAEKRLQNLRR
eukprot:2620559-Pyramimonas_sp.AAC.1